MVARRKSASTRGASARQSARRRGGSAAPRRASLEFAPRAEALLERLGADLAGLADQRPGGDVDADLVDRLFRSAHSLKGLAGMFGLDTVGDLVHHLEEILDGLRVGRIAVASPAVELLGEAVGMLGAMLTRVDDERGHEAHRAEVAAMIGRIGAAIEAPTAEPDEPAGLDLDPSLRCALTAYEEHRLRENLLRGRELALVDAAFELIAFEDRLSELSAALSEVGEVIATLPSPGTASESRICFALLVATDTPSEQLCTRLDLSPARVRRVGTLRDASAPAAGSLRAIGDSVRVGVRKLEELRAAALDVRTVPLRPVFENLVRAAGRLRGDHDKDVQLDFEGADTELDERIVERLVDPLVHVVRNAFDHAIESVAERLSAGKDACGSILVQAIRRDDRVVIEVSDDGRGIDSDAVRRVAEKRGTVSSDDVLSEQEQVDLVFAAGLSTRQAASKSSGRGVGLDVVRASLAALGGAAEVSSVLGRGTTIKLTLPGNALAACRRGGDLGLAAST